MGIINKITYGTAILGVTAAIGSVVYLSSDRNTQQAYNPSVIGSANAEVISETTYSPDNGNRIESIGADNPRPTTIDNSQRIGTGFAQRRNTRDFLIGHFRGLEARLPQQASTPPTTTPMIPGPRQLSPSTPVATTIIEPNEVPLENQYVITPQGKFPYLHCPKDQFWTTRQAGPFDFGRYTHLNAQIIDNRSEETDIRVIGTADVTLITCESPRADSGGHGGAVTGSTDARGSQGQGGFGGGGSQGQGGPGL